MAHTATPGQRDNLQDKRGGSRQRGSGFFQGQLGYLKAGTRALYETGWRSRQASARAAGKRNEYVGDGRFRDKGGRQVGSAFGASEHNERIKYVYGNYNLWSWFRYWYIDSCNLVSMIMIDKGYFDYDFEKSEKETVVTYEESRRSDEEIRDIMAGFGIGVQRKRPETLEEIQGYLIKEEKYNGSRNTSNN